MSREDSPIVYQAKVNRGDKRLIEPRLSPGSHYYCENCDSEWAWMMFRDYGEPTLKMIDGRDYDDPTWAGRQ